MRGPSQPLTVRWDLGPHFTLLTSNLVGCFLWAEVAVLWKHVEVQEILGSHGSQRPGMLSGLMTAHHPCANAASLCQTGSLAASVGFLSLKLIPVGTSLSCLCLCLFAA